MKIKEIQSFFELIKINLFAAKYGLSYDHLKKVLKEERVLTEKYAQEISEAVEKFKKDI